VRCDSTKPDLVVKRVAEVKRKEQPMKKLISVFLLVTLCALSSGCGVKDPLYFPEQDSNQQTTK
jgi:hypothetical protein